jgi:hypothetical protein
MAESAFPCLLRRSEGLQHRWKSKFPAPRRAAPRRLSRAELPSSSSSLSSSSSSSSSSSNFFCSVEKPQFYALGFWKIPKNTPLICLCFWTASSDSELNLLQNVVGDLIDEEA